MNFDDRFTVTDVLFAYNKIITNLQELHINRRPSFGITLVLSGNLSLTTHQDDYTAKTGDIFMQRKNDSYLLKSVSEKSEYIVISYDTDNEEVLNKLLPSGKLFVPEHPQKYYDLFQKALSIYHSQGICSQIYLNALVQEILCIIIRENYPKTLSSAKNPAAAAKFFMDEFSQNNISSEDIAAAAGCSSTHLRRLFKAAYGITPIKYLNRVRIERAKEMLSSGLFTQEEISTACGFSNPAYFNCVFKNITGVTPGKY